mgnify:CR=1 FL=1
MKFQTQIILIILLAFINRFKADDNDYPKKGTHYPGIKCGKDKIKKEKDCTKYGTDSGMLCCYVKDYINNQEFCTLLNHDTAKNTFEIHGEKNFSTIAQYWSCGNKSIYIPINIILFLILYFLY